jgi:Domain of unknown function (DUF222)/HNH endonuclease
MEVLLDTPVAPTVDQVERRLVAREHLMRQLIADQLADIRWMAAAGVPEMDGARSLKEWLASRLDWDADRAGELARAATLLEKHPGLENDLADGETSFDRAVATARLVDAGASAVLVESSAGFDIAGVRRLARRHRRVRRQDEQERADGRFVRLQPSMDGMGGSVWGELPATGWTVIDKALHQRADELPPAPDGREALGARLADALVSVCQDSLDSEPAAEDGEGAPITRSTPAVTVFVDAALAAGSRGEAGAEVAGAGLRVGPSTLEEILCTGTVAVVRRESGTPISTSGRRRAIPPAIRSHVLFRDGGCTVDGCTSRYRLEPHHIDPHASGGSHDPRNLTTLCWYHHHVVIHVRGFTIDVGSPPQRRRLKPPTGEAPRPPP